MQKTEIELPEVISARHYEMELEYLKASGPDDWHRYAVGLTEWDRPLETIHWILRQPDCDKATAVVIFWKTEPVFYDFESETQQMGEDPYAITPILHFIVRRFNTDGFSRSELLYDHVADHGGSLSKEYDAIATNDRLAQIKEIKDRQAFNHSPFTKLPPDLEALFIPGRDAWEGWIEARNPQPSYRDAEKAVLSETDFSKYEDVSGCYDEVGNPVDWY